MESDFTAENAHFFTLNNRIAKTYSEINFIFRELNSVPTQSVLDLISNFLQLEKVQEEGNVYGVLPINAPSILPRAKPVPAKKAETRWERFAKEKGTNLTAKLLLNCENVNCEYGEIFNRMATKIHPCTKY